MTNKHEIPRVRTTMSKVKVGADFEKLWKASVYETYDKEKHLHLMRGLTLDNPLMINDKDFEKQKDLCMKVIGNCFVKEYVRTDD